MPFSVYSSGHGIRSLTRNQSHHAHPTPSWSSPMPQDEQQYFHRSTLEHRCPTIIMTTELYSILRHLLGVKHESTPRPPVRPTSPRRTAVKFGPRFPSSKQLPILGEPTRMSDPARLGNMAMERWGHGSSMHARIRRIYLLRDHRVRP